MLCVPAVGRGDTLHRHHTTRNTETMPSPRDALKSAIRAHPGFPREGSRELSTKNTKELYAIARRLGLDPGAIYRDAKAGAAAASPVAPSPRTWSDDDVGQYEAPDDTGQGEPTDQGEPEITEPTVADAIETEVRAIREAVTERGFSALDERLRELITEARKPPVTVYVEQPAASVPGDAPVIVSKPTGKSVTWKEAFRVGGAMGNREAQVWDGAHPDTPKVDPLYLWPPKQTAIALSEIADGQNVFAFGPAGTGKTEWTSQLAATLGRPYALISCDNATDGPTLVGMTIPAGDGVRWQDGQLTRAIQIPGCVICIDEPSVARPGALFVLQNVLQNRVLWIAETGRRIPVARGVVFVACDNTAGMGGGARRGYTDTNKLNYAFLDRFGARVKFDYLSPAQEARVIASRVGCPKPLAELLIKAATLTRAAADQEQLTAGIGLRRLLAWARLLHRGHDVVDAFDATIINASPEQDHETLRQQCALAIDASNVRATLAPPSPQPAMHADPSVTNATPAGRAAARDFQLSA